MLITPTYSPLIPQNSEDFLRPYTRRYARYAEPHPVSPLKGHQKPRAASVSYRASVPAGHGGRGLVLAYRALSPYGESLLFGTKGNLSASPILYSSFCIHHSSLSYTFSAKERDAETGLSYFGSRYYSSDLSIWLSVDPQSDKYASLSPYVYCADNPVRLVDPNGEKFRLIGRNTNIAFRNYLLSYNGVDCMNIYDAFSLAKGNPNMIMFKDPNITYKQFSSNYQEVTGVKLKNKDAKKLFKAIKSDFFIEVNLLSKESISRDCMYDELSSELLTGEPAFNAKALSYNPAVEQIMMDINSDDFNAAFNSCIANYETNDSKFFFNTAGNNTIINPPKGFMLVNAIGKSAKQAQETLIKEILDFYNPVK